MTIDKQCRVAKHHLNSKANEKIDKNEDGPHIEQKRSNFYALDPNMCLYPKLESPHSTSKFQNLKQPQLNKFKGNN